MRACCDFAGRAQATVLFGEREGRLRYTLGQFHAATDTERLYDSVVAELYYSAADDRDPPAIETVAPGGANAALAVTIGGGGAPWGGWP